MTRTDVGSMRRIGILGGSSDHATADYYRRLNKAANDLYGGWNTAEVIISSMNFAFSRECAVNGKWEDLSNYLCERALALERAGAELIICASNTLHRVADSLPAPSRFPFYISSIPLQKPFWKLVSNAWRSLAQKRRCRAPI
jgi:aspartate racemase